MTALPFLGFYFLLKSVLINSYISFFFFRDHHFIISKREKLEQNQRSWTPWTLGIVISGFCLWFSDSHIFVALRSKLSRLPLYHVVETAAKLAKMYMPSCKCLSARNEAKLCRSSGKATCSAGQYILPLQRNWCGENTHYISSLSPPLLPVSSWPSWVSCMNTLLIVRHQ